MSKVRLRTKKLVDEQVLSETMAMIKTILDFRNEGEILVMGIGSMAQLTRLVKQDVPIDSQIAVIFLETRRLLEEDGSIRPEIFDIVDAAFDGCWLKAVLVDPETAEA